MFLKYHLNLSYKIFVYKNLYRIKRRLSSGSREKVKKIVLLFWGLDFRGLDEQKTALGLPRKS